MPRDQFVSAVVRQEAVQLSKLVSEELDRRCAATDDIIQRVYNVMPAMHPDRAMAEVKVAILEQVRSSLVDLERELACVGVKTELEPATAKA